MRKLAAFALSFFLTTGIVLADTPPKDADAKAAEPASKASAAKKAPAADPSAIAAELDELRQALQAQQEQIQMLKEELARRDHEAGGAHDAAANPKVSEAVSSSAPGGASVAVSDSSVGDAKSAGTMKASAGQAKEEKLSDLAYGKIKIGATFFGNFSHYNETGAAPAFQDLPTSQLGPGNDGLNVFEVTRTYVNLFYTPNEHVTLRVTPDIYRQADQSLSFRLKYAFVDFQDIFGSGAFKKTKLTFGQTQQPLTDWEEGLSGYRYAYLTPWNYLSLSSTYVGARLHGPIEMNGKEYLDYDIGVFTTASFHATETSDKKQAMARLTVYPFGTTADRTGLGLTVFENYGYNTQAPSAVSTPLNRLAVLAHYQTHDKAYQIAFEYQLGRNATSTGNMFSGAKPAATDPFNALAATVLAGTHTRQEGYDLYGHARLGHSPFSVFGLYQYFKPNTNFQPASAGLTDNPLNFARTVGGLSYKVTDHFDFSIGDQNFHWLHPQGVTGPDTNAFVIWTQFNY